MLRIVPAVLSDKIDDYEKAIRTFENFEGNKKVHIDIMDGEFVETVSADLAEILEIKTKLKRQVHLMVAQPEDYIEVCHAYDVDEIIFHLPKDREFSALFERGNTKYFLGINPEVSINEIEEVLSEFDGVTIMTVNPGLQGQPFLPENLNKVIEIKALNFKGTIEIDGHVNIESIDEVIKFDVDELVVGSGIIKQDNPENAYEELKKKLK